MIDLKKGDITSLATNAIVNAANNSLSDGAGVNGAIHRAAGSQVLEECQRWVKENGELATGNAMFTTAGNLPASHIIHTVGPVWHGGTQGEDQLLASCYINSLHICERQNFTSVAFPNISTGIFGYPKAEAAEVAVATVKNFMNSMERDFSVSFVCFDEENYRLYKALL